MTLRKQIVYNASTGKAEVLQTGDYVSSTDIPTYINGDSGSHIPGQVVYPSAAGTVQKARANAAGTMPAIALAQTTVANGVSGAYQSDGTISLTTAEWDAVAGTTGGLTAKTEYFVSGATAGLLTATPPATGYAQPVIIATSTTDAIINVQPALKL